MAPKSKGKPGSPALLVTCPDDGSPPDCSLLLSALQDESGDKASAVLSSLQQLPITDATVAAIMSSGIPSALMEAIRRAQATGWEGTPLELLFRTGSVLVRWRGSISKELWSPKCLESCMKCVKEWGAVANQTVSQPTEAAAPTSPVKGKKGAPPPEPPKIPGPPPGALAAAVKWLAAATQSSYSAASWAASSTAAHYILLLRHPSAEVLEATFNLLSSLQQLAIIRTALIQDAVAIYLWRLIENPQDTPQPIHVKSIHLLASFVEHTDSTACLDLYDEHAVPRLVNMLTQPTAGLNRVADGEQYENAVEPGQPPRPLSAADVEVQQAVSRLLSAVVCASPICCGQAVHCGLGYALATLLPSPDSQEALRAELDAIPVPQATPLPSRPSCCDPEGGGSDYGGGGDAADRRMLSLASSASAAGAPLAGASSLASTASLVSNASRRSSRRGSRRGRSFRSSAADGHGDVAAAGADTASAAPGSAAAGEYAPAVFELDPTAAPLPPRTVQAAPEAWRGLQRLPLQPTCVAEVLVACVQMLRAVLVHGSAAAWVQEELWPARSSKEWAVLLCCLCFPTLRAAPPPPLHDAAPEPPPDAAAAGKAAAGKGGKGKGKGAVEAEAPPRPLELPPLLPPFAAPVRVAALQALDGSASDADVMDLLRQGCLMHALEACMLPAEGVHEGVVAAAAPLLTKAVSSMVEYDTQRAAYAAAVAEALKWQEAILGPIEASGTSAVDMAAAAAPGSPSGSAGGTAIELMTSFSRANKSRRSTRSRSTASKASTAAAGRCPVALPAIPDPIPPPGRALDLVAAVTQTVEGLPLTIPAFAPVATVASGGAGGSRGDSVHGVERGERGDRNDGGLGGGVEVAEQEGEGERSEAGRLGGGEGFGRVARFEVARAAMVVELEEWKPPPRPPLDAPPPTPPPEPLPLNGYLWTALGKTAMVVDGLDLSPDKLRQLEAAVAARDGGSDGLPAGDGAE